MSLTDLLSSFRVFSVRFLLVSFLPTLCLISVILALIMAGAPHPHPEIARAFARLQHLSIAEIILLLIASAVGGVILYPLQFSMIRFLEGYWGASRLAIHAALLASSRYERMYERWDKGRQDDHSRLSPESRERTVNIYDSAVSSLPAPGRLMPTRLGNVLRAAEDFAGERYGLSTVTMVPRLIPQLSPKVAERLADSRLQLDVAVRFCLVWLIATAATFAILVKDHGWLWIPAATYALAWLCYRASCAAAEGYGLMLAVAIDLHRFDLLQALHQPLPRSYRDEIKRNRKLSQILNGEYRDRFLSGDDDSDLPRIGYGHPDTAAEPQASAQTPDPSNGTKT